MQASCSVLVDSVHVEHKPASCKAGAADSPDAGVVLLSHILILGKPTTQPS